MTSAVRGPAVSSNRASPANRWAILGGLGVIAALAWIYVAHEAHRMSGTSMGMTGHSMATAMHSMVGVRTWTGADFVLRLVMWAVMMVAMMVPSAAPMTLVYAAVARKAAAQDNPVAPTFVFVGGYLALWGVFALAATTAQLGLARLALLSPAMVSTSPVLGGVLLIGAGAYQLTPLKRACLEHCRAPALFISRQWRSGGLGAFRMGLHFGTYCVGCCWILMGLLFVGGVMNLAWIAGLAVFVLVEKTVPFGKLGGRLVGATMIGVGALSLAGLVAIG